MSELLREYQKWAGALSSMNDVTARFEAKGRLSAEPAVNSGAVANMPRLLHGAIGLAGEVGEIHGHIVKALFQGGTLSKPMLVKELGDCLWYITECATALDVPLEEVLAVNVAKLNARYPEHKFDADRCANADRSDEEERKPL